MGTDGAHGSNPTPPGTLEAEAERAKKAEAAAAAAAVVVVGGAPTG